MRRFTRISLTLFLAIIFLSLGAIGFLAISLAGMGELPQIETPLTSTFYDRNNAVITTRFEENRFAVPLEEVPLHLQQAFIAVEDHRFYSHPGIDLQGLLRAVFRNIRERRLAEGGSTITQQLARNLFLSPEKTFARKAEEMFLTIQLERRFTKQEILEKYLNTIYFGHAAYGVEAASRTYFAKSVQQLSLAEAAILAGIPRGPALYSPHLDFAAAKRRQDTVLTRMVAEGYISEAERQAAQREELVLRNRADDRAQRQLGAHFIDYLIEQELAAIFPEDPQIVYRGGLHIYTTLDRQMQQAAESAVARFVPETSRGTDGELLPLQAALVSIDPEDGAVRAMVGSRDFRGSQFNRAVAEPGRASGSAFKVFTYAAALEAGETTATVRVSEPVSYELPNQDEPYEPLEYSGRFYGALRMRDAIARSSNVVAVKTHLEVGPEKTVEMATRLGIISPLRPIASLPLGPISVSPLEMATAYVPFANLGVRVEPRFISKITDSHGRILYQSEPQRTPVLEAKIAYLMTDMLKSVLNSPIGTGRSLGPLVNRPAAAKTGTSQGNRDAYIVGYTPDLVTAVWVGNDENLSLPGQTGSSLAGPVWANFMREAHKELPAREFSRPGGLISVQLCPYSSLLHNPRCELAPIDELFIAGTEPQEECSWPDCPHCPPEQQWDWDGGWWFRNPFQQQ
ncbi:MAG: PBP1A family penicillin-binding protein [Dethiobacter sp.]|jgi:1A family penicillin-binding protein|nr:PBP1A family penicillin-binding protein [Dethiobacter sp.]MBS3899280.1 PBP1A family penicillin-binding protein [Dethiobacter sp.]MBS3982762.1 PBP1A family penicillin-binding protein [Dethiobacter sp.]MCL4462703.1 PBP1A family penicillin-binding protein [Bacillota bacterium]MCL5994395.1 PBP1A family penicillin-binding protein [Bacillota bacterium]